MVRNSSFLPNWVISVSKNGWTTNDIGLDCVQHFTHITKTDFPPFKTTFNSTMMDLFFRGGFRGPGLVPLNPISVMSKLNITLRTLSQPVQLLGPELWESKTPQNPFETHSQSEFIKTHIQNHQDSSPTSIILAVDQLGKSTQKLMHSGVLMASEVAKLQDANHLLTKRRMAKKNTCEAWRITYNTRRARYSGPEER